MNKNELLFTRVYFVCCILVLVVLSLITYSDTQLKYLIPVDILFLTALIIVWKVIERKQT